MKPQKSSSDFRFEEVTRAEDVSVCLSLLSKEIFNNKLLKFALSVNT